MDSTVILVLGGGLIIAAIVGLIGTRKWKGWQRIAGGRSLLTLKRRGDDGEPKSFEFTVVRDREANPDGRRRQEIIETLQVGEPVMLIEEIGEDGHVDFRVVVNGGTIGYVARNRLPALRAFTATGATMQCEVSYIVRQAEGAGIWVRVGTLRD